jgi:hypothetical protein
MNNPMYMNSPRPNSKGIKLLLLFIFVIIFGAIIYFLIKYNKSETTTVPPTLAPITPYTARTPTAPAGTPTATAGTTTIAASGTTTTAASGTTTIAASGTASGTTTIAAGTTYVIHDNTKLNEYYTLGRYPENLQMCKARCTFDANCAGFSHSITDGEDLCSFVRDTTLPIPVKLNSKSYIKNTYTPIVNPTGAPANNYTKYVNQASNSSGNYICSADTVAVCEQKCTDDVNCKSFVKVNGGNCCLQNKDPIFTNPSDTIDLYVKN